MRKCPNPKCGFIIENDKAKYCKKCGTRLEDLSQQGKAMETVDKGPADNTTQQPQPEVETQKRETPKPEPAVEEIRDPEPVQPEPPVGGQVEDQVSVDEVKQQTPPPFTSTPPRPSQMDINNTIPERPKTYVVWAILSTLLCCVPLGIYAIVCSTRVDKYYRVGNYSRAQEESKKAKTWSIVSAVVGLILPAIIWIAMTGSSGLFDNSSDDYYDDSEWVDDWGTDTVAVIDDDSVAIAIDETAPYDETVPYEETAPYDDDSSSDDTSELLELGLKGMRGMLPMDLGNGLTMTDVRVIGKYVYYIIECDEDVLDVSLLDSDVTKDAIRETLQDSDSDIQYFINICVNAGKGIAYQYVGDESGHTSTVRFSKEELERLSR